MEGCRVDDTLISPEAAFGEQAMRPSIVTFLYHEVIDPSTKSGFQGPGAIPYKHDAAYFRQNLDAIASAEVSPSTIDSVNFNAGGRYLLLTFDDGGISAMQTADLIEERGWLGHFFITTNMIGSRYFLTAENIRELRQRGHRIGSHSHTHPHVFCSLADHEMVYEWDTSCKTLSQILGEPIVLASVPGGDMDRRTVLAASQVGIQHLFTSEPTLTPWTCHGVVCLGRLCPKRNTPLRDINNFAHFRGVAKQMAIRRCKQTVKRLLSPVYYRWANR